MYIALKIKGMKLKLYFLIIFLSTITVIYAQDGSNDPTFNPSDTGFGNGTDKPIETLVVQPDGKIIVGGAFQYFKGTSRNSIARINPDETLDLSFNPGSGANGLIKVIKLSPTGKIFIGGDFTEYNGVSRNRIALLNSDGSLDTSFNPQSGCNAIIEALAAQSDGKVVVGGKFTQCNGSVAGGIARLNSDGSRDSSFIATGADPTYFNGPPMVHELLLQPDGKIIVGGTFYSFNSLSRRSITRLNTDGSTDGSFLGTGFSSGSVLTLALAPDNKIYVGGWQVDYISRLNADGTNDTSFTRPNMSGAINDISVQQDSKIVLVGLININNDPQNIARLNSNGTIDNTFLTQGFDANSTCSAIAPSGKIIVGGYFLTYNGAPRNFIASINSDGSADPLFNIGIQTGADSAIQSSIILPDEKIIIVGDFLHYNNEPRAGIAKLDQNGLLDTSFNPGSGADKRIKQVYALPNGKFLIIGDFTMYNGQPVNRIARINADGTLDMSFTTNIVPVNISKVLVQNDGKIIFGGRYLIANAGYVWIVRVNIDGSIDGTFNNYLNDSVYDMKLDSSEKIVVVQSGPGQKIVRLNTNGTIDNTFTPPSFDTLDDMFGFDIQPDGKIVFFNRSLSGSTNVFKLRRLNSNGSLDTGFVSYGPVPIQEITIVKSQADGKIIVSGKFTSYNGFAVNGLVRLNNNGSVDTAFDSGLGANDAVHSILLQENDKIIISGNFVHYNGIGRNRIARIFSTGSTLAAKLPTTVSNEVIAFRNNGKLTIVSSNKDIEDVQVYDISGKLIDSVKSAFAHEISLYPGAESKILLIKVVLQDGSQISKKIY